CLSRFFCFYILRAPPSSTLFPYTTLFRSLRIRLLRVRLKADTTYWSNEPAGNRQPHSHMKRGFDVLRDKARRSRASCVNVAVDRSEEHTSELQSRGHLVCRLLLEKKNEQN